MLRTLLISILLFVLACQAVSLVGIYQPFGQSGSASFSLGTFNPAQPWANSTTAVASYDGTPVSAMIANFVYDATNKNATFLTSGPGAQTFNLAQVNTANGQVIKNVTVKFGSYQGLAYDPTDGQIYCATLNTEFYWQITAAQPSGTTLVVKLLPNTPTNVFSIAYSVASHQVWVFGESLEPYGTMLLQSVNVQTKAVPVNLQLQHVYYGNLYYSDSSSTLYAWVVNSTVPSSYLAKINTQTGAAGPAIYTTPGVVFQTAQTFSASTNTLYAIARQPNGQKPKLVSVNLSTGAGSAVQSDLAFAGFAALS